MHDNFYSIGTSSPPRLLPFMSNGFTKKVDNRVIKVAPHPMPYNNRMLSLKEIQSNVAEVVRKVISLDINSLMNYWKCLMDMGLDFLSSTALAAKLESCFNVQLPTTFVFNLSTVVDISNHIYTLLAPHPESIVAVGRNKMNFSVYTIQKSSK